MVVMSTYPRDPRVRREAEALAPLGVEVDLIAMREAGQSRTERIGNVTVFRVFRDPANKESLARYALYSSVFLLVAFGSLIALSLRRGYRVVQVHNMPDHLVFTALIHRLLGVPVVLDLHDLSVDLLKSRIADPRLRRRTLRVARVVERLSCAFASDVIVTSKGFRDALIGRGVPAAKVTLVMNAADESLFAFRDSRHYDAHSAPTVIYHGTVAPRFGLGIAVRAFRTVVESYPDARLLVHGKYDPSHLRELRRAVAELELSRNVRLAPYLPLDRVPRFIDEADIGLVPYCRDEFMELALSTKAFEYVARGVPVVASRLAPMRSIFDDDAVCYFEPDSPDDLAKRLLAFWQDPERRERAVTVARDEYAPYAWHYMAERYRELILRRMRG